MRNPGQWFEVWLVGADDEEGLFRTTLRREGHDLYIAWDSEGNVFLAARIRGDAPSAELRRLFVRSGLSGGFQPLPVSLFGDLPCGIELGPLPACAVARQGTD
jgi:hypothetical protein